MARQKPSSYADMYAREKARVLEQAARAWAGSEGPPPGGVKPNDSLEASAWNNPDPNVTPQHLAEIAQQTVAELMQDRDETGMPRWNLDQIDLEVKYRQSMAVYPWRHLTYDTNVPPEDYEARIKAATRAAKRYGQPAQPAAAAWSEPMDETEAVAAISQQPPAQPQQPMMPQQPPMGQEGAF